MSNRTRSALGEPGYLAETIALGGQRPLRIWRAWQAPDSVIVGILPREYAEDYSGGLFKLQCQLLDHFFRLLVSERRLSGRARRGKGGGRTAVRQMEMERRR